MFAGWLFMCLLMRTIAADPSLDSDVPKPLEQPSALLQEAAPSEAEAAKPEAGSTNGLASTVTPTIDVGEPSPQA